MPSSQYLRQELMDHTFGNGVWTPPSTLYVALFTTMTDAASGGTEVVGNAYARQIIAFGPASVSGLISNTSLIQFPQATPNDWGEVRDFGIYDAPSAGNRLWYGELDSVILVYAFGTLSIPAGGLILQLQ